MTNIDYKDMTVTELLAERSYLVAERATLEADGRPTARVDARIRIVERLYHNKRRL